MKVGIIKLELFFFYNGYNLQIYSNMRSARAIHLCYMLIQSMLNKERKGDIDSVN